MTETETSPHSTAAPEPTTAPNDRADGNAEGGGGDGGPTAWAWLGRVLLALVVLVTGAYVGVFGPLLAISCEACQDGIRSPLRFWELLLAVQLAVPVATLATLVGVFLPRGGARAGGIGLAVLGGLLILMLVLGQFTG